MNPTADLDDDLTRRARLRVNRKLGFYTHALVFVLVNLGLAAVNLFQSGHQWHLWTLAWWGFGLAIHGLVTLVGLNGDGLRERMLAAEVERLKSRR